MNNISDMYLTLIILNFFLTTFVGLLVIVYNSPKLRKDLTDERPHD